jgi:ADP-ribosyl-[dinitrogen reductase] hydrolase
MISNPPVPDVRKRFAGLLLGTAVGDALGLPAENLSADKIKRRWGGKWKMRFIFGRGMVSDDTEHTVMVAQALLEHPDEPLKFQRSLAWKLRWWFLGLPGGVGLATARACLKLWLGFPVGRSGVKSAGSGPAMRSAVIGVYFAENTEKRKEFVLASSRLTHRSWQAETAALAVAECSALAVTTNGWPDSSSVMPILKKLSSEPEWQQVLSEMETSLNSQQSVAEFARRMGLERGVSGYSLHVVPVAIYAWLLHPADFRVALTSALDCGGDTDTVGAIVGALAGTSGGKNCIPNEWLDSIWEWPRSQAVVGRIADRLSSQGASGQRMGTVHYFWPAQIFRNLLFFITVLVHGFYRIIMFWK